MGPDPTAPAGVDTERPSAARMYDYLLGGAHNFAADRRMAEQLIAVYPQTPVIAQANRAFLRRAVQYLVEAGVRQFLDVGSGIPTVGHVHEIAHATAPTSRVVYVDIDAVAVAHSRDILGGDERVAVVQEDVRRPEAILGHPDIRRLLDLDQPVAVLAVALLHFLDEDDPADILRRLTGPLVAGSYLALSHGTEDGPQESDTGKDIYRRGGVPVTLRTREQVAAMFAGFELVDPGLVWLSQWRPDPAADDRHAPEMYAMYAGVGRKR